MRALSARAGRAAGAPIGYLMEKALANPELVSLAAGFVDQHSLPVDAARAAAHALLSHPDLARAALQYGTTSGCSTLRAQVLERVLAQDVAAGGSAPNVALEQVVLTAGSNQLLYLLAEALLDPGDIVLCDAPTYFVFTGVLRALGARAIGIASDGEGMRIDALTEELARLRAAGEHGRVKAIYVMSYFDNPRSVSLSRPRRSELVRVARDHDPPLYVIEDAAYRELRYRGDDLPSLLSEPGAAEHVIYAGTFSKSFSPGVRVGFGFLPEPLVAPVLSLKDNLDFGSPHLNQRIVSEAMRLGSYEPHVAALRAMYARKCASMVAALERELGSAARFTRPDGGLYVWLELAPELALDTGGRSRLFELALEEGVLFVPGEYCFPDANVTPSRSAMRLSFGVQSEARIALGIERLARAVARARD